MKKFILLLFIFGYSYVSAQEKKDLQLWNTNAVAIHFDRGIHLEVAEKIQYTTETRSLYLKHGDIWLKHELTPWFEYGAGFRLIARKTELLWKEEQRFMVLLNLNKNLGRFELNLSNRFEHRTIEDSDNHFRYREMLSLNSPQISLLNTFFFVSEEAFLRFDNREFHLFRLFGGIQTINSKRADLKVFYAYEKSMHEEDWKSGNILGMNLKFKL